MRFGVGSVPLDFCFLIVDVKHIGCHVRVKRNERNFFIDFSINFSSESLYSKRFCGFPTSHIPKVNIVLLQ